MSTGAEFVNIEAKRILGLADLDTRFFQYLQDTDREFAAQLYALPGVFEAVTFGIAVADEFDLSPNTFQAQDGAGRLLEIPAADSQNVPFENALATAYYVALTYAQSPVEVQTNPRTGLKFYTGWEERVGFAAPPTAAVDNGADLTFDLSTILDPGESHVGRTALVWLNTPETGIFAEAVETCVVAYAGGVSRITTAGLLGQAAPSVVPGDYTVMLVGPRVSKTTDYSAVTQHVYLGTVTGAGAGNPPAASSTVGQRVFWSGGISDLANVLETGPNGDTKIAVKAHAADVGVRQVTVINPAGVSVLEINELGVLSGNRLDFVGANGLRLSGGAAGEDRIGAAQRMRLIDGIADTYLRDSDTGVNTTWAKHNALVDSINDNYGRLELTVGSPGKFNTVAAAVAAIVASGSANQRYRIRVIGTVDEVAAPIDLGASTKLAGLEIVGGTKGATGLGSPSVRWAGDVPLFNLNGQDGIIVRDLSLIYTEMAAPFAAPATVLTTRAAIVNPSGAGNIFDFTMDHVIINGSGSNGLHGGVLLEDIVFGCHMNNVDIDAVDFGVYLERAEVARLRDIRVDNDTVLASVGARINGIWVQESGDCVIDGCFVESMDGDGLHIGGNPVPVSGAMTARVSNCLVRSCGGSGAWVGSECNRVLFSNCDFEATGAGVYGIVVVGSAPGIVARGTTITGCTFLGTAGWTAVQHGAGANPSRETLVVGNNLRGLVVAAAGVTDLVANNNP